MPQNDSKNNFPLLSAKSALLFFAAVMLVYFFAGAFIQNSLGLLGIFLNQILMIGAPVALVSYAQGVDLFDWPSWKLPAWKDALLALLGIFILSLVIDKLIEIQDQYFPPPDYITAFYEQLITIHSWPEGVAKVLVLTITPAVCEEIFFRGLLLPSGSFKFGKVWGNVFVSLAFALAHGNILYFHFYFILGLYLGLVFNWKNSLWLPILAHFANNAWTLFAPS